MNSLLLEASKGRLFGLGYLTGGITLWTGSRLDRLALTIT